MGDWESESRTAAYGPFGHGHLPPLRHARDGAYVARVALNEEVSSRRGVGGVLFLFRVFASEFRFTCTASNMRSNRFPPPL